MFKICLILPNRMRVLLALKPEVRVDCKPWSRQRCREGATAQGAGATEWDSVGAMAIKPH